MLGLRWNLVLNRLDWRGELVALVILGRRLLLMLRNWRWCGRLHGLFGLGTHLGFHLLKAHYLATSWGCD